MQKEQLTIDTATQTSGPQFFAKRKTAGTSQTLQVKCPPLGFTLVETIVAIGLFTIVLFIATSAFLTIVNTDRKARSVRIAMDNLNLALEDMSRRIKTGSGYDCGAVGAPTDCPFGESMFAFINQDGTPMAYTLSDGAIMREATRITSSEITIDSLVFVVKGTSLTDNTQPSVLILVKGSLSAGPNMPATTFTIQTLVTQRAYDA